MKVIKFSILLFFLTSCMSKPPSYMPKTREVIIVSDTTRIVAEISISKNNVKTVNALQYHWYSNENIYHNYGGYSGYLLNGDYHLFSVDNKLLIKGTFKQGLKEGVWRYWDSNGSLSSIENWSNGVLKKDNYLIENKESGESIDLVDEKGIESRDTWFKRVFGKKDKTIDIIEEEEILD